MTHLVERVCLRHYRYVNAIAFTENQAVRQMARDLKFSCAADDGDAPMVISGLRLAQ